MLPEKVVGWALVERLVGGTSGLPLVGTSGETSGLPLVGRRLNLSEPESIPVMIPVPRSTRHLPGETYPLDINDIQYTSK